MYICITTTSCDKLAIQNKKICTFHQNEQQYFASYANNCLNSTDNKMLVLNRSVNRLIIQLNKQAYG